MVSDSGKSHPVSDGNRKVRSVDRVREYFAERGIAIDVLEMADSTRTAQLAAQAVGTALGSIVKSLVFITDDDRTVLALVAGDQRADNAKIARLVDARTARLANGDEVRARTSYAIGGVPPVAHATPLETLVDRSLLRFARVWAAAGAPNALFGIEMQRLIELTRGRVDDIIATVKV